MVVFLIIVAVLALLIIALLSLSATFTIVYDKGWKTKIKVLFIEKEISISNILNSILFPEKKAEEASDDKKKKKAKNKSDETESSDDDSESQKISESETPPEEESVVLDEKSKKEKKPSKTNFIKKMWEEEGLVGILTFVANLLDTANSAIINLIRGLHIYSLYVMIIVGGDDAAQIAQAYGRICSYYYPVKGLVLSTMKVDNFDEHIQPDFIAPCNEYQFQFIGSISVGAILKAVLKAGIIFVKNLIKNKKENKKV